MQEEKEIGLFSDVSQSNVLANLCNNIQPDTIQVLDVLLKIYRVVILNEN